MPDREYVRIEPDERGWLWSNSLELYLGVTNGRLRYFTPDGRLVPTPEEGEDQAVLFANQESLRAEQEKQRAEQEKLRADSLAEKLRALGLDPDSL